MAKIDVKGFEDVEKALLRRMDGVEDKVKKMLKAGAAVTVQAHKDEIERVGLVDTGDMRDSIKATKVKGSGSEMYIEVYPHGEDRKGVRNAHKALIHEYGKSKYPARPYKSAANAKCKGSVMEAMREVWNKENE